MQESPKRRLCSREKKRTAPSRGGGSALIWAGGFFQLSGMRAASVSSNKQAGGVERKTSIMSQLCVCVRMCVLDWYTVSGWCRPCNYITDVGQTCCLLRTWWASSLITGAVLLERAGRSAIFCKRLYPAFIQVNFFGIFCWSCQLQTCSPQRGAAGGDHRNRLGRLNQNHKVTIVPRGSDPSGCVPLSPRCVGTDCFCLEARERTWSNDFNY